MAINSTIKLGYKQTELGLIPEEWDVKTIKEIAPLQRGFDLPSKHLVKGNVPVVYSNGIENYHSESKAKAPGVVTGRSGTIGKVTYLSEDYWPHNTSLWVTSFKGNYPLFIYYLYKNIRLERFGTGSGVPTLNRNDVHDFKVSIPKNVLEQTAIATILFDTDRLIENLEKLITKKKNIKHGTMQLLLTGKKRLPGFSEEWKTRKLGDFLDYIQPTEYLVTSTEYNDNNPIPVLTAGKTFILGYTDEENGIFRKLPVIIFDDFTTAVQYVDFPFKAKSSAMKMLVPKNDNVNLRFIFEIMLQIDFPLGDHKRHWICEYQHIEIKVPTSSEEQNAIADVLSSMDKEVRKLQQKRDKYISIKQGMMQQLLTGKIRVYADK